MKYQFQFGILQDYGLYMVQGAWYTITISFWSILFSTVLGLLFASILASKNRLLRNLTIIYIDVFRTVPLVCLLIWIHYVLPILINVTLSPVESAIISLSLNGGAQVCEAFRGGMEAIPITQHQAAYSLGFSRLGVLRYIVIPQAVFSSLPAYTNVCIIIIKNMTVSLLISVPEVMYRAQELSTRFFRPLELYTGAALIYVALILVFSYAMRRVEKLRKWEPI